MNAERWQRLKGLYNDALDASPEDRSRLLDELCAKNPELAAELRALLQSENDAGHTFDSPFPPVSLLLDHSPQILAPGTLLARRFRIVRHLGSGGMGDVYEAEDEQMEHGRIALKTIRPSIARSPLALTRFKDEVRLARQVTGPHVCRIHELYLADPDVDPFGPAFLTMELLEGTTLHDRIADGTTLPMDVACTIAAQLCAALTTIHGAGIVHQDLKPRNVMLVHTNGTERVVVMDFGLARTAVSSLASNNAESAGLIAGTPSYMAPEQFEGREVGPATDIYALGLILYEMATGIQPYAAHTPLAAAIRRSKPPAHASAVRRDLPAAWDEVITRCLCYDPEERYPSAEAVHAALTHSRHVVFRFGKDRRLAVPKVLLSTVCALALILLLTGAWWRFGRPRHRELAPDAAHWYALGMTALREGSYLKATRLLSTVVERDPSYALAHAALADAWTELDFTSNAQREMLLASSPDEQKGLDDIERRYIDAVRTTLVRDYSAAAQDYETILKKLPEESKAQGYVDLGRIYEKAGKVPETLDSYETAARLNPDDPAPFLHLGILRSRLRDPAAANKAFNRAEFLYNAESDLGGLAEVAYQRGYAANDADDAAAARQYLNRSLAIAHQIHSSQLEVRSLAQLSSVAYNNGKVDDAIQLANQVVDTARENELEYWVTDGLVRLGNAELERENYPAAEAALQEALHRARDGGHPRLQATASFTLASLRSQQGRPDEVIENAQRALKYFQDYGFVDLSDQALVLITRAQRRKGDYGKALATGVQLLVNAEQVHRQAYIIVAEESIGFTLFRLQRYPEALTHFDHAAEVSGQLKQSDVYIQLARADLLWQLGRYAEAKSVLENISGEERKRNDVGSAMASIDATMRVSQGDAHGAIALAQATLTRYINPPLSSSLRSVLLRTIVLSELDLGEGAHAKESALLLDTPDGESSDAWQTAQDDLARATLLLHTGDPEEARNCAHRAESFFAEKSVGESDALSLLVEAEAADAIGDKAIADKLSQKCVDILRGLQHSWGVPVFRLYLSRPDRQQTLRALTKLRATYGDTLDDLSLRNS